MPNLDTAKAVLAKASLFDQSFATPDMGIAVAWAEALGDVNQQDAMRVVTAHYSQPSPRRIMPGDVLQGVRKIRAERLREHSTAEPEYDPDDVLGGIEAIRRHRAAIADGRGPTASQVVLQDYREDVGKLLTKTAAQLPRVPRPKDVS